jgi:hypothetical protein
MNADVAWTVMVAVATMLGAATEATRMVAMPGATPRTTPLASTVAMLVWSDVNVTAVFAPVVAAMTVGVSVTVPPTAIVAWFGDTDTAWIGGGAADTVTGIDPVTVWPFAVTETVMTPEPAAVQFTVAPVPLPVTVKPEPLGVKVTVGVPVAPPTVTPTAVCVPATHDTDAGLSVSVGTGWTTVTSSPHAASAMLAAPATNVRQLTSLIR